MTIALNDAAREFLARPNPCVMATVAKDGRPVAAATWYALEDDGRILVNIENGRVRLTHLANDPRFALDVVDADNWYTHLSLQLVAVETTDDTDLADIDALSRRYGGNPYPTRDQPRTSIRAEIVHVAGWGAQKQD
jgi:PPOX class probable F420-dependent enzyme